MRRIAVVCWLALAAPSIGSSTAAGAKERIAPNACKPVAGPRGLTRDEEVQELYEGFACRFARGEYAASLPLLERACRLTDSPRCLLNFGAVHHALMDCDRARDFYERYLDRAPYDGAGDEARAALEELRAACPPGPAPQSAAAPAAELLAPDVISPQAKTAIAVPLALSIAEPPRTEDTLSRAALQRTARGSGAPGPGELDMRMRRASRTASWTLLGAGAASGVAALVAAAHGRQLTGDHERRQKELLALDGFESSFRTADVAGDSELRAIDRRGRQYNQLGIGLGAASLVLVGMGATLWALDIGGRSSLSLTADASARLHYQTSF